MGELQIIRTLSSFEEVAGPWDACLDSMARPSFFLTSAWLRAWWQAWGEDLNLQIMVVLDPAGEVEAGAALCSQWTSYYRIPVREWRFVGEPAADRQEFLCRPGREKALSTIWEKLRREAGRYDIVRLEEIPDTSDMLTEPGAMTGPIEQETSSILPFLPVAGDWETYEKSLVYKFRSEMRTREKTFNKWGSWDFSFVVGPQVEKWLPELAEVEKESRKGDRGYALLADPSNIQMLRDFILSGDPRLEPVLSLLQLEGKTIGYLLGFVFGNKYHAYNMAFLPAYRKGSPGKWIMHNTIRFAFEKGLSEFDFMRGASYIKSRWNPQLRHNRRLVMFGRSPAAWLLRPAVFWIRPWLKRTFSDKESP